MGDDGARVVEGRSGVAALAGLYADSLVRLRASTRLRHSLALWSLTGLVLTEAFTVGLAQTQGRRAALLLALAAAAWWLVVTAALLGGAALLVTPGDARDVDHYGVPNGLTVLRAYACLPLLLSGLLPLPGRTGLVIFGAAGGSVGLFDAVDGFVARRVGPLTMLGRALDPAMDAVFFSTGFWASQALGIVPTWMMILVVVRYLGPLLATPLVLLARRRPELVHTTWGRRNTLYTGVVVFVLLWVRIFNGPTDAIALALGVPLLGVTTLLHFRSLAVRAHRAPVVRPRRRDRIRHG